MTAPRMAIGRALSRLPDLDSIGSLLDSLPPPATTFVADEEARAAPAVAGTDAGSRLVLDALDHGRRAISKIQMSGTAAILSPDEQIGLESIVLTVGRPAILVQDGSFFPPPAPWQILEQHRPAIEKTLASVGRVEVTGHPTLDWIGTAFLVDHDAVITNRHVAQEFLDLEARDAWRIDPRMTVNVDFAEELGSVTSRSYAVTSIIGLHPTYDLALLRIDPASGPSPLPAPLPMARSGQVQPQQRVYVVGYPAADSRRNNEADIQRIFSNIFNVKRLLPGLVTARPTAALDLAHDCSTLGGNSGSCLVDLESNLVLAVHYRGRYLISNYGISLQGLVDQIMSSTRRP